MNKDFWKHTLNRAIRTVAQTAVATIGTSTLLSQIDWKIVVSSATVAGILSILTSITLGIPESGDMNDGK